MFDGCGLFIDPAVSMDSLDRAIGNSIDLLAGVPPRGWSRSFASGNPSDDKAAGPKERFPELPGPVVVVVFFFLTKPGVLLDLLGSLEEADTTGLVLGAVLGNNRARR